MHARAVGLSFLKLNQRGAGIFYIKVDFADYVLVKKFGMSCSLLSYRPQHVNGDTLMKKGS